MKTKKITYWASVIVIGVVIGLALQFAKAWVEPSLDPVAGNVDAPINIGNADQIKIGGITAGYLSSPKVCLNGDCRTNWPSFNLSCPCGTCWSKQTHSVSTGATACHLCKTNGYTEVCTPNGWKQAGFESCIAYVTCSTNSKFTPEY